MTSTLNYNGGEDVEKSASKVQVHHAPQYVRDTDTSKDGLSVTLTRITALGSRAGTVQNYTENGDTILLPTPTDDPNDPLNWSRSFKWFLTCIVCAAAFMSNLTAAGPSIAIIQTSMDFGTAPPKTAYLYSCAALLQGLSMFFWSPLVTKYGKRPVYILSYLVYLGMALGSGASKTWETQLVLRCILGAASGAGEMMGPITIGDIWFVHERSTPMAAYNAFLSVGVAFGMIIDGFITRDLTWRYIYWVSSSLVGALCILVIFCFPETSYKRPPLAPVQLENRPPIDQTKKQSYWKSMALWTGETYTEESFVKLLIRPFLVIAYPAVLWAAFCFAGTIGFLVAVTTNVALAYQAGYGFGPAQVGSCFTAGLIGSVVGIAFGGQLSDFISKRSSKKNKGVREPEMRLPALAQALITSPLALILFGAGIQHKWHWIVPTIGLGLLNFSIVSGTNVALVYAIDCYKPIASEVVTAILGYKAAIGFLLSFYTNEWVASQGYQNAYGEMAGIAAIIWLFVFLFYFAGKRMRQSSLNWHALRYLAWHEDRDDAVLNEDE